MSSPERGPSPQEQTNEIARVLANMGRFDHGLSASQRAYMALDYMQIRDTVRRVRLHAQALGMIESTKKRVTRSAKKRETDMLRDARRHEQELVGHGDDAQEILGA